VRWFNALLLIIGLTVYAGGVVAGSTRVVVPIGEAAAVNFQINAEGPTEYGIPVIIQARLSLLEALRGAPAGGLLQTADPTNEPPVAGLEYLLIRVRISGEGSGTVRTPYQVQAEHFRIFDAANQPYPTPAVRLPGPALIDARIYPNDISEGWLVFLIDRKDQHPEMFFFSGQWFQIVEE
jgi:hypothetical protein